MERVFEVVDLKPTDRGATAVSRPTSQDLDLELRDVSFSYRPETEVLHDLNLEVSRGDMIVVQGANGSGKTTLFRVILGLYPPTKGTMAIRHDGDTAVRITYVPQEPVLFYGNIEENITCGRVPNQAQFERVVEISRVSEFAHDLPDGIHSLVGERGSFLSGGQRQRVAIARALYIDPSIMLLDEPTSSIDVESKALILEAIVAITREMKTSAVIISHDPALLQYATQSFELKSGSLQTLEEPPKTVSDVGKTNVVGGSDP